MKNKSFLNKLEELKPQIPVHLEVERKLLPRLKFMGYVMFVLSLISFGFALTVKEEALILPQETPKNQELETVATLLIDDTELELAAIEVLNFYAVSFVFAAIGGSCFLIAWKKRKSCSITAGQ